MTSNSPLLGVGAQFGRRVEVALGERRRLEQLAVAVAVAVRGLDLARGVEDEPGLRALAEREPVGGPARDHDVVVLAVRHVAEDRLERPRALADEDQLVALAVAVEAFGLLDRAAERDLDVVVPHQAAPAADRVAARLGLGGLQVAVDVRVGDPLAVLDRLEGARLGDPARRLAVVEDRLVAREALVAHHLLDEQPARAVVAAELRVALRRELSEPVVLSQVASLLLLALDRLEQGLEVALAEAAGAVALDHLEEDGRAVADRLGEDLQQVALVVAVGEDPEPAQVGDVLVDLADPSRQLLVIARPAWRGSGRRGASAR